MNRGMSPTGPQHLLDAQTVDETAGIMFIGGLCDDLTIVIQQAGTTSSGIVTVEEAYYTPQDTPYSGQWSLLTTVDVSTLTGQTVIHFEGSFWAVRVRISTVIAGGGTVSAWAWGN